jgi:hypothetical protein
MPLRIVILKWHLFHKIAILTNNRRLKDYSELILHALLDCYKQKRGENMYKMLCRVNKIMCNNCEVLSSKSCHKCKRYHFMDILWKIYY